MRSGRNGGGLSFGYQVRRGLRADGTALTGELEIIPEQALVIRRIFDSYAIGQSPRAIARALNTEGVSGPRGGSWTASLLLGGAARETGLLRNRLYVGERVWNRQRYLKDPGTGRRIGRVNPESAWVVNQVPELAIIRKRSPKALLAFRVTSMVVRPEARSFRPTLWSTQMTTRRRKCTAV